MKKIFSVLLLTPIICLSQANILNTKKSSEIETVSRIVEGSEKPYEYEHVSDDDIIFSFTTWEVIDLNQRVNFPLYFPTDINIVTEDRRPLIHYLFQAIQDPQYGVPAYLDDNLTIPLDDKDIEGIKEYKRLKKGADGDGVLVGEEWFADKGSWKAHLQSLGYEFPDGEEWVNYDPLSDQMSDLFDENPERYNEFYKKWELAATSIMADEDFDSASFDPSDVRKYLIKGIWYFDKKSTQLRYRPIAIGPVAVSAEDKFEQNFNLDDYGSSESGGGSDWGFGGDDDDSDDDGDDWGWGSDDDDDDDDSDDNENTEVAEVEEDSQDGSEEDESEITGFTSINQGDVDPDKEYTAMFWVFFPEVREVLHKAYAFNDKNMSKPMSFDHLINSRQFAATIYKEANVYQDRDIRKYINNNSLMQLLESERIREKIRNREQDMWSY